MIDIYGRLADAMTQAGAAPEVARAHYNIAMATQLSGNPAGAIEHFRAAIPILERTQPAATAVILNQIAGCHLALENYRLAWLWFNRSLNAAKDPDVPKFAVTKMNAGLAALKLRRFSDAVRMFDEALRTFDAARGARARYAQSTRDHLTFARRMQQINASGGDTKGPVASFRLRPAGSGIEGDRSAARQLLHEGQVHMTAERWQEAEVCCERARTLLEHLGPSPDLTATKQRLAEVCFAAGRLEESIGWFLSTLSDVEGLNGGDPERVLQLSHALAVAFERSQGFSEAAEFYKRALSACRRLDRHRAREAVPLLTCKLADLLILHGEPPEAARWCDQAVNRLGELGRYEDATRYATSQLDLCRRSEDLVGQGRALGYLGNLEQRSGRLSEALASWRAAADCFRKSGDQKHLQAASGKIKQIKAQKGRST